MSCCSFGIRLKKLQSDFKRICCTPEALGESDMRCMMDWPFNDVPSCKAYDIMRNSIFARYGYSFKSEEWKTHFESIHGTNQNQTTPSNGLVTQRNKM